MPFLAVHRKLKAQRLARWERIDKSLGIGMTVEQIAEEEGVLPNSISRQAYRHGRRDLGLKFNFPSRSHHRSK